MNRYKRSFASDNNSIVHPKVMGALQQVNHTHELSYGEDAYTQSARGRFKEVFGQESEVFFVFNGTGANVTGLAAITLPHQAIICAEAAHINVDECGAVERFVGCRLLPIQKICWFIWMEPELPMQPLHWVFHSRPPLRTQELMYCPLAEQKMA